jgi:hypothetical protein
LGELRSITRSRGVLLEKPALIRLWMAQPRGSGITARKPAALRGARDLREGKALKERTSGTVGTRNKVTNFKLAKTAERLRKPGSGTEEGVDNPARRGLA